MKSLKHALGDFYPIIRTLKASIVISIIPSIVRTLVTRSSASSHINMDRIRLITLPQLIGNTSTSSNKLVCTRNCNDNSWHSSMRNKSSLWEHWNQIGLINLRNRFPRNICASQTLSTTTENSKGQLNFKDSSRSRLRSRRTRKRSLNIKSVNIFRQRVWPDHANLTSNW